MPKSYPTYAIWLKDKATGRVVTVYVTGEAATDKWVMADSRPESIPVWYGIKPQETAQSPLTVDAVSGAPPLGEAAEILWQVPKELIGKKAEVYIEANNSFDYTGSGLPGRQNQNKKVRPQCNNP